MDQKFNKNNTRRQGSKRTVMLSVKEGVSEVKSAKKQGRLLQSLSEFLKECECDKKRRYL